MRTNSFTNRLMALALVLATVLSFASCSDSPADLINYVPNDTKAVLTIKPKDLAKKGNLEKYIKLIPMDKDTKDAVAFAKECFNGESGINMEQIVVFEYENAAYMMFVIDDIDKFSKLDLVAENMTKGKTDGFDTFEGDSKKKPSIVIDGKTACIGFGNNLDLSDIVDAMKTFSSLDKDKSVASLKGFTDNMGNGDLNVFINLEEAMSIAGGASEQMINKELSRYGISADDTHLKDYINSRMYMCFTFDKDKLTIDTKTVDEEGNNLAAKLAGDLTIDTEILKYFDKSTSLVYATVLPEFVKKMYSKMIESNLYDETQKAIITELFNNLGDNVAFGLSLSGPMQKTVESEWGNYQTFNYKCITGTLVAKCKKSLAEDIQSLASLMEMPVGADGSVVIPIDNNITVTVKADGKYLVITNGALATQPFTDPGLFKNRQFAMVLNLTKNSPAAQSIKAASGISLDLTALAYSDKKDSKIEVKVNNNTKDNVLDYFIDLIVSTAAANQ